MPMLLPWKTVKMRDKLREEIHEEVVEQIGKIARPDKIQVCKWPAQNPLRQNYAPNFA